MQPGQWDPHQAQIPDPTIPFHERPPHLRYPLDHDQFTGAPIPWIIEQSRQAVPPPVTRPAPGKAHQPQDQAPLQARPAAPQPVRPEARSEYQPTWRDRWELHWRKWAGLYVALGVVVVAVLIVVFGFLENLGYLDSFG